MTKGREASIWFIDDDPLNNLISTALVEKQGKPAQTQSFLSATEALDALRTQHPWPEMIFLDLNMPECDGWEFLERFARLAADRANDLHPPSTRVTVLSSSIQAEDIQRALAHPAVQTYLSKPLTPEKLQSVGLIPAAAQAA